jgi:hypothetical protein
MSDIVDRLRAPAYWMSGSSEGHEGENDAPRDAADTITRLRAENKRLGRDYNTARDGWAPRSVRKNRDKLRQQLLDIVDRLLIRPQSSCASLMEDTNAEG